MAEVSDIMKKMCVIGEANVGKTSLIRKFVLDKFDDRYISTIGTKTSSKELQVAAGEEAINLKLQIWDILGMSSFSKIQKAAYRGASGAFLVLDLTRKETLYSFDLWLFSLYEVAGDIPVVVLGNKNDLKPEVGRDRIEELVKGYGFPYYLTSAKTGEYLNDAFQTLGEMMVKPWAGIKTWPELEISNIMGKKIETEPDGKLTPLVVEDMIIARFCELFKDPDVAMGIIREQIERVDMNFRNPTREGLEKVIDFMINAASNQVEASQLKEEKIAYTDLIRRIG